MYSSVTSQPYGSGTYLFVDQGGPSNTALDVANPALVPDVYHVMILDANGIITEWAQYNTLADCVASPDNTRKLNLGLWAALDTPSISPVTYPNHPTNEGLFCDIRRYMTDYFAQTPLPQGGWMMQDLYWYGASDFAVGTTLYINQGGVYVTANNQAYIQTVLMPTAYGGNLDYTAGAQWTDLSLVSTNYVLIRTDAAGVITEITHVNTIPTPPAIC
jgi:hypothetical protein